MPESMIGRSTVAVAAGITVASLALFAGCSKSDDSKSDVTTTTAAKATPTTATDADATTDTTGAGGADDKGHEAGNADIKAGLSESDPELWALIDYDTMSWDTFSGFTIPVADTAEPADFMTICEKVSDIVYGAGSVNASVSITIATGVSMDNLVGTAQVTRDNEAGSCEPVS